MFWKVTAYGGCGEKREYIVEAETKSKANYQGYKQAIGDIVEPYCKFFDFMRWFHSSTQELVR